MIIGLLLNPWAKYVAAAALSLALVAGAYVKGRADKGAAVEKAMVKATIAQLKERGKIDVDVSNSDITDICVELGGLLEDCR